VPQAALTIGVGLVAGVLSGMFGIGGGLVTTPAIRLLLGFPALIAVGTPLPVILPTAVAGAVSYARRGLADVRAGVVIGLAGAPVAVVGAWLSGVIGGRWIMVLTAASMLYVAADMAVRARSRSGAALPGRADPEPVVAEVADAPEAEGAPAESAADSIAPAADPAPPVRAPVAPLIAIGVAAGLYSGLLGLGGGFVVVPALARWLGFPLKRAIGTSLVTVALLSVPGSAAHLALGHVDLSLAAWLVLGTVPGALIGARLTAAARERHVAFAFATALAVTGVVLAVSELLGGRA
jgi:uncharacterized membrane protein YfcA